MDREARRVNDFQQRVAARFAAAAATYDAHSAVQRHAAQILAGLIAAAGLPPRPRVLEVGCGTGHLTQRLTRHLPGARILATDIAPAMVTACRAGLPGLDYAVMDGSRPGVAGPFDLICANLAAQWFVDLPAAFARLAALLAPGGMLAFSLLGAESFREWRAAHACCGLTPGTPAFPTPAQCGAAFPAGGLLHMRTELHADRPADGLAFLRGLRALGADTPAPGHVRLSPAELRRVMRTMDDAPTISYELIYARWHAGKNLNLV